MLKEVWARKSLAPNEQKNETNRGLSALASEEINRRGNETFMD